MKARLAAVESPSILQLPSAEFEATIQAQTSEVDFAAECADDLNGAFGRNKTSAYKRLNRSSPWSVLPIELVQTRLTEMSHGSKQETDDAARERMCDSALADAQSGDLVQPCQYLDTLKDEERRELSNIIPTIRRLVELEWRVRQLSEPLAAIYPKAFGIAQALLEPRKSPALPTQPTEIRQMATEALRVLNAGDAPKCGPKGELSRLVWEVIPQVADCHWMLPDPPTDSIEPTTHAKLSELVRQYVLSPSELVHLHHEFESTQVLLLMAILGFDSEEDQEDLLRNRKAMLHLGLAVMRYRRATPGRPPQKQKRTPWQIDVTDALKAAGLPHDERILRR